MSTNRLSSEPRFIKNILIRFFSGLVIVLLITTIALIKTLITSSNDPEFLTVTIESCYDGDTCTTTQGEKIRLACIDTPELRGMKADPIAAKAAKDYLNTLIAGSTVTMRRITEDRYGRTVAELLKDQINIQEQLVEKGFARIYEKYASQCKWSKV